MKFALVSDLHLEFAPITLPKTDADILLLAGDIVPISYLAERRTDAESRKVQKRVEAFIEESLNQYAHVFHIMGNHEFYHGEWGAVVSEFREYWDKNAYQVQVLDNEDFCLMDGLRIWGGTLWTDFSGGNPIFMNAAQNGLNDYRLIKRIRDGDLPYARRYSELRPSDTQEAHETSRYALKEAVEAHPNDKWIVMTHHAPSFKSVEEKYQGDILNYCFASELDTLIEEHPQIHTWAHGHTHGSHDYTIGDSRVLCNPRGYARPTKPNSPENANFNPTLVFDV